MESRDPPGEPLLRLTRVRDPRADVVRRLHERGEADFAKVEPAVRAILDEVRTGGDAAVLAFVERFERRKPERLAFALTREMGEAALGRLAAPARAALERAAARIRAFHERERDAMFPTGSFPSEFGSGPSGALRGFFFEDGGRGLGLRVRPLARVGVYAPGGKARYPSSVLMSAIPAVVAGASSIVLATPLSSHSGVGTPTGEDDSILAAAHLAGVTTIVDAGGAQAIAALAYGTASIPQVDKIVGPGNAYVACAKRLVYGSVAIDSIAGPSEILVVADRSAHPADVAADLLSQAEHDEDAYAILLTSDPDLVLAVEAELALQLPALPRAAIAGESLRRNGEAIVVEAPGASEARAVLAEVASAIAPEHLSLQVENPEELLARIPNIGAAFVGGSTPEAAGDYLAGPSHVLPTGGAVRFGSPLGVHDFVARTSVLRYTPGALADDAEAITTFARLEGLEAHARAVLSRTSRTRTRS